MPIDAYRCPACKGPLAGDGSQLACNACGLSFPIHDGIPDFLPAESMPPEGRNDVWLRPEVVEARDTKYRLCARDLRGMAFCVQEIGKRTFEGCRVLEAGMGTGHFTAWLAEASAPGTEIYAFDYSWPMLEKARANIQGRRGRSSISLFRANARGALPFEDGAFDIVFLRLAPLSGKGVSNVQAAHKLLKPGGWYFEASWRNERFDTPPTQWATDHGFEYAEHHSWRYLRLQSEEEYLAGLIDASRMPYEVVDLERAREFASAVMRRQDTVEGLPAMTDEELVIAHKPTTGGSK